MILPLLFFFIIPSSNEYEILIDGLQDTMVSEEHRVRERLFTSESMGVVFVARANYLYVPASLGSIDMEAHTVVFYLYGHDSLGPEPASIIGPRIGDIASGISPMMINVP